MTRFLYFPAAALIMFIANVPGSLAKPPKVPPSEPIEFTPPKGTRVALPNGLLVYLLESRELPMVQAKAMFRTGTIADPPGKTGLARLLGEALRAGGSRNFPASRMNERLEYLGASIESEMALEHASASMFCLSKNIQEVLEIFADIIRNPAFETEKVEIERQKLIEEIRRRNDDPYEIARREAKRMLYGTDHPYGRRLEIETVKGVTIKDLADFHARHFTPGSTMIAFSGDFNTAGMFKMINKYFGDWTSKPAETPGTAPRISVSHRASERASGAPTVPSLWLGAGASGSSGSVPRADAPGAGASGSGRISVSSRTSERTVYVIPKEVTQAAIRMVQFGFKRHHPDHFAFEILDDILGGSSFCSRLFSEIRSRQGLVYYIGSYFTEPTETGVIGVLCGTKNATAAKATREILRHINAIRTDLVKPEEINLSKESIINSFVFNFKTPFKIISQRVRLEYYGYPPDYLDTYLDNAQKVTRENVLEAAKSWLRPESMIIMMVGDPKSFDEPPSVFGKVVERPQ